MKPFEVTITMPEPEPALHMVLDANHWMAAWKAAMRELGLEVFDESQVTCKIRADGAVEVVMPDLHGRRFLVASAAAGPGTTQDRPAGPEALNQRASITIEEMKAVTPVEAEAYAATKPSRSGARLASPAQRVYPRVFQLNGGEHTNLNEAITMLANHVPAEYVLFLIPTEDRTAWTVAISRSPALSPLDGAELSCSAPVPGPVDNVAGRRHFPGDVTLTFIEPDGMPMLVSLESSLWAPVRVNGELRGVFLVLNATRDDGFNHSELEATQQLASLVASRMSGN